MNQCATFGDKKLFLQVVLNKLIYSALIVAVVVHYGSRRIAKELEATGICCGKYKTETLMKLAGVEAKQ
jgi:hypothetical protein